MADREKVIKGLEELYGFLFREYANIPAEESKIYYERTCAIRDALAMLKEQDAVEPRRDANCVRMFRCGACGEYVGFIDSDLGDANEQDNYCRNCGRKVKWKVKWE